MRLMGSGTLKSCEERDVFCSPTSGSMFLKLSIATFQDLGPKVNCAAAYKYDSPNTTCACASSKNNIVSLESIQLPCWRVQRSI